jgi:hypothetical protein
MRFGSSAGFGGIFGIVAGMVVVCEIITLVTGAHDHWLIVLLGILVGLMSARSIGR